MSREILFRGKSINNGEWVYGYLARFRNFANEVYTSIIQINDYETQECSMQDNTCVIPETVGQFTGLTDKNGKKIFEGDICGCFCNTQQFAIKYCEERCGYFFDDCVSSGYSYTAPECLGNLRDTIEVIGNIYDNKELLGE